MEYDPVKDSLGSIARLHPALRRAFYRGLDLIFLRTWYVQRMLTRVLKRLKARSPETSVEVLDAGCGFGQYSYFIAKEFNFVRITAVDIKKDYLEDCRRFFDRTGYSDRVHFCVSDLTNPDNPPFDQTDAFDLVLCVDVMEHVEDDAGVLNNFSKVLKPGGYLIVNTPSDTGGSDVRGQGDRGFIGEHVREGYGPSEMKQKLEYAGLTLEAAEYGYGVYGSLAWKLLVKYPMLVLGRSRWLGVVLPLYYLPSLPIGLLLNAVDLRKNNASGTGLTVLARKPA